MNDIRVINKRVSRRVYTTDYIESDIQNTIKDLINIYNVNTGMTTILLEDGSEAFNSFKKSYGLFTNVKSLIVLKGPKKDDNLKEKTGYYGQRLVLKATQLGLGTCWVGGTFDRSCTNLQIADSEDCYCVITIGHVSKKLTSKEYALKGLLKGRQKLAADFLDIKENYEIIPDYVKIGLKAISKAPSAMNLRKVRIKYENKVVSIATPNRFKYDMIDLGIAKANFEIAANHGSFSLGNNSVFITK